MVKTRNAREKKGGKRSALSSTKTKKKEQPVRSARLKRSALPSAKAASTRSRLKRSIGESIISDDSTEFTHCKHTTFDVHNVNTKICKPQAWLCSTCDVSHDVWICLSCGKTGCGRDTKGHAYKHFEESKHPIALHLNKKHCYCYACEEYVVLDNKNNELELIRRLIEDVQTQESSASYTRSGRKDI